jgi:bis(5'-adenosyl)-triphosphatase
MDCPFCASNIDEITIRESKTFRAIYNIAPILPGHTLIIPKFHKSSLFDFSNEELSELMLFSKEIVSLLQMCFECEGFNLTLQEKEEAGQTIDHFHWHVIPRQPDDLENPGDWYPELKKSKEELIDSTERPKLSRREMLEMVNKLKSAPFNNNMNPD